MAAALACVGVPKLVPFRKMSSTAWTAGTASEIRAAAPVRHSALVRITHWLTTACFLALLVSGVEILISHPRFYWGETGND